MTEEHRAVVEQTSSLGSEPSVEAVSGEETSGRNAENTENTVLQKSGQPFASHMTLSPSCVLLHLQVLIYLEESWDN